MSTNREPAEPLTPEEEREFRERIAELIVGDDIGPGPWHHQGFMDGTLGGWFDNPGGDSSFPDPADVAMMLNEVPRLLATLDAERARWDGLSERVVVAEAAARAAQDVAGRETPCPIGCHTHIPGHICRESECGHVDRRAQDVTPPPDALRKALHAAIDDCDEVGWDESRTTDLRPAAVKAAIDEALAALRAQGVVQSPELDVERLRDAINESGEWPLSQGADMETARIISDEYAALRESGAPS